MVKELLQRYPDADFVYLGDTARAPYGDRSPDTIRDFSREDVEFLINHGISDIVIACNSASANALPYLRSTYPDVNFYGVIEPTIQVVKESNPNCVVVFGTRATVNSMVYQQGLREVLPNAKVVAAPCPLLVPWVEEGFMEYGETQLVVQHYVNQITEHRPDSVILGCTHYPPLLAHFREALGPEPRIIMSSTATVEKLPSSLFENNKGVRKYCFTDITPHLQEMVTDWLGEDLDLQRVAI